MLHTIETKPLTVCATLPAYTVGKALGVEEGMVELNRQLQNPDAASLPGIRTIHRLRTLADLHVRVDTGGTQLCQVRSRHAHDAWECGADVWFSVDDDNEATKPTLANMLEAVKGDAPRIVMAPYVIRGAPTQGGRLITASVELPSIITSERRLANGARLRPCKRGGFGLIAINRPALAAIREACKHLAYLDHDDVERLALFHAEIRDRVWLSDDFAFFSRVPPEVSIEALLTGLTVHDGATLNLAEVGS